MGFQEAAYTIETCIIIVKIEHTLKGVIVDKILDVFDTRGKKIEAVPLFEESITTEVFLGMVEVKVYCFVSRITFSQAMQKY